jgi:pimeloyl-ACP methyl ester carboxylesterase
MRLITWFCALALAGCRADAPAEADRPPTEAFAPTAFTVAVHGHGRPIILIPGLGCPGAVWDATVAHLDGYETHVLTLAGFAGLPRIPGPLAAATRAQLAHYIRSRKLVAPIIVGHSLGGYLAYWLAETEPSLVGPTIVIESAAALGDGTAAANAVTGEQVREMWVGASDEQFSQLIREIFGSMTAHRERLEPFLPAVERSDRKAIADAIYEQYTNDLRPQLGLISAEVLLVLADGSLANSMRTQVSAVPHHTVVQIPNAKHFVMLDEPEAFYRAIDSFLAKAAPGSRRACGRGTPRSSTCAVARIVARGQPG